MACLRSLHWQRTYLSKTDAILTHRSRYQSTQWAEEYTTLGYLAAIMSLLGMSIMPRAKFVQTMMLNVVRHTVNTTVSLADDASFLFVLELRWLFWNCIVSSKLDRIRPIYPQSRPVKEQQAASRLRPTTPLPVPWQPYGCSFKSMRRTRELIPSSPRLLLTRGSVFGQRDLNYNFQ